MDTGMIAMEVKTSGRASAVHHAIEEAKIHLGGGQPGQGAYREPREEQFAADLHSKMNRRIAVVAQVQQKIALCKRSALEEEALAEPYHASACCLCQASCEELAPAETKGCEQAST